MADLPYRVLLFPENSAKIQYYLVISPRQFLEWCVCRKEYHNICFVVGFFVICQLEHIVLPHIGFHNQDIGIIATLHHFRGYIFRGALTQIVDIRFKSQAHHSDTGFAVMLQLKLQHNVLHFFRTPERLIVVDISCIRNQFTLCRKISCDKIRVNSDAMTTHTATWLQNVHSRMLVGKIDKLPHINTCLVANQRKFIRKGNLYITTGIFCNFGIPLLVPYTKDFERITQF